MKTANGKMSLLMSDGIANAASCPRCNASLEREYHSYMGVFAYPLQKVYSTDFTIRTEMNNGIYVGLFCPLFMRLLLHLNQKLTHISLIKYTF